MSDKIIKTIATFFGIGYLPFAPGTWGSAAGAVIYFAVRRNDGLFAGTIVLVFLLGIYSSKRAEKIFAKKDDKRIIIDEVFGTLFLFLFLPHSFPFLIAGFALFRLFDVLKPFPIRKIEALSGSMGIMADDIIAAFYSYVIIYTYVFLFRASGNLYLSI